MRHPFALAWYAAVLSIMAWQARPLDQWGMPEAFSALAFFLIAGPGVAALVLLALGILEGFLAELDRAARVRELDENGRP